MNIKKWVKSWILPEEEKRIGELYIRTADGKTTITVSLADNKDAYKAKQLVNFALQDTESYDDDSYHLGMVDMGGDDFE